ncbi:hypothetical protein [Metabacillus fastidiosus]|uniref:hypothetical protein n=2 Tax=Metabacillus fastidiosus TaxID=1458 RepID=UPI000825D2C5|nr:hypothetical protein [Metabacillus fastidiosus]MED4462541.1 hypothetical protein [Metabacillus fastidiosus]
MDEFELMLEEIRNSTMETLKNSTIQIDQEKLEKFKGIISELVSIRNKYKEQLPYLRTLTEKEIVNFRYSKGGEAIHRGYYCPSPVLDLIVGGLKRGKLFKRKPDFGRYSYEYCFDSKNRLILVRGVNEFTTPNSNYNEEYLFYNCKTIIGLEFRQTGDIVAVSRCTFANNNIVKYERSICSLPQYADLYIEEYAYENNLLSEVRTFQVTPRIELYIEDKFKVEIDEDGKIIKLIGGTITNGVWEQRIFNFKK